MGDVPVSPTKGSALSSSSLKSRIRTSYFVPQNSPSSFKIHGNEDNYKRNNGEKKSLNHKLCPHHKDSKPLDNQSEENKSRKAEQSDLSKTPAITEFSMFYEQQQLVERKTQSFKEKNSATVIFKSDAKVISSTDVLKHDAQTNTGVSSQKNKLNSSIISIITSKPEEEDQPLAYSGKMLNVQKMPSVNIRPGFTIQHGPKVNIVGSSYSLYKPKRRNTEFFDVVYPPSSPVFSESSFVSEQGRQNRQMENQAEYICERHTFPSGRLIPASIGENLRQTQLQNSINVVEKKEILIELIKSVTEKVEQQSNRRKKTCCRLVCSLPLLASVVKKIQVDCVKCVDRLNSHLDRLVVLMKEEIRGYRELSEDHCCQLDEAIHYQIVELELMQEENLKRKTHGSVTVVKHKESETSLKTHKKTVSFESIPDELEQSATVETRKQLASAISQAVSKENVPSTFGPRQTTTCKTTRNVVGNSVGKMRTITEHQKKVHNINKPRNSKQKLNPILKKKTIVSASAKETTVIDQVITNLTHKKSISKPETVLAESKSGNSKNIKCPNGFIQVIDQRESTSEFEKWIEERSLKIRQIHEELNKMVAVSMEKYLEIHSANNDKESPVSGLKLQTHVDNENISEKRTVTQHKENKDMDNKNPDSSVKDAVQEYEEDFEEDVEELTNLNSSVSNFQQNRAEAENDLTPSSSNEEVITEEVIGIEETPALADKLSSDVSNISIAGENSSKPRDVEVSGIEEIPAIQFFSDLGEKSNNANKEKPNTISVATSPINFKTSSQNIDESVNTTPSHDETRKVSTATSPVILTERSSPQFKSTMMQTERLGIKRMEDNNQDDVDLTIPPVRLTPKSIENIFKITLGDTKENSLALHTESSNQTLQLVVQLPALEKQNKNQKISELDCSDQSERDVKTDGRKSSINVSTNLKSTNSADRERKFCNTSYQDELNKRAIKDIIEPTVSEVLKKISEDNNSSTNPLCLSEELNKPVNNPNTSSGLVKPNIILQTKCRLWNKYVENPILSFDALEQPNPKVDSSNQTEAEKQSVYVQVARSVAGSECETATSVRLFDGVSSHSRGYLEMLLPPPPPSYAVPSSSTSRSSSTASTSSNRNYEGLHQVEKLSDGELLAESCNCRVGEVCEVCVPRLDLSFGELKTKKRSKRAKSGSSSDHVNSRHSSVSISGMPKGKKTQPENVVGIEQKSNMKQFSEIARSVLNDLGKELHSFSGTDSSKHSFPKPLSSLPATNFFSARNAMDTSSSDSFKSSKSQKSVHNKKSSSKHDSKPRASLVIKTPVETPRIDAFIEDAEMSTSSYQTSVTSVSVDQIPEALSNHLSADASS